MAKKQPSPNDQRAVVKNPNNRAFAKDQANQAKQGRLKPATTAPTTKKR